MSAAALSNSETFIMNAIWDAGGATPAKSISARVSTEAGCTPATVYSYIHRLIEKGAIVREEPGFIGRATIERSAYQAARVADMVDRLFGGNPESLLSALVTSKQISPEKLDELKELAASIQ